MKKLLTLLILFVFVFPFSISAKKVNKNIPYYTIGPGDVLEISVWQDERLDKKVVVPPDGVISYPLIGDINVKGLTVADLRRVITQRLKSYIPDAIVTVMLLEINSLKAYVIGKVNRPGEYPIGLNTNVMQILAMAGGFTPFASPDKIIILRKKDGKLIKIPFNYDEVVKGKNLQQVITLKRGDVVVVP
ncbi:MAG: polysaccharide export protein [Thermodesulfobacteria bacterium]|nr:polysaccharide export protein [Thermodesulfobacteriota bacterium]